jgi:hypothetical protein
VRSALLYLRMVRGSIIKERERETALWAIKR